MKRLTLIVIFVSAFIGISLTLSLMAIDGSLAEGHERKRFRADLQTTSRLVDPPPGVAMINPGFRQSLDCLRWLEQGTRLSLVPWSMSNPTAFARMVPSLTASLG
jgi:hypothetical protein